MEAKIDIAENVQTDEVVRYIAGRYHATTESLVRQFLIQKGKLKQQHKTSFRLAENEVALLSDMGLEKGVKIIG